MTFHASNRGIQIVAQVAVLVMLSGSSPGLGQGIEEVGLNVHEIEYFPEALPIWSSRTGSKWGRLRTGRSHARPPAPRRAVGALGLPGSGMRSEGRTLAVS